jgi:hypothetical protein
VTVAAIAVAMIGPAFHWITVEYGYKFSGVSTY